MKYEWKKEEKTVYNCSLNPVLLNIPKCNYICIKGKGNPNKEEFTKKIGVLYSLSYAIKMMPKKGYVIKDYFDYTVYPLEGLWSLTEKGLNSPSLDKEELLYTIMIKQPSFVNDEIFIKALEIVNKSKPSELLKETYFECIEDGLSVQVMHIGSYDSEPVSFNKMKEFIKYNKLEIKSFIHREIYISDSRKTEEEKKKTILRYRVKQVI